MSRRKFVFSRDVLTLLREDVGDEVLEHLLTLYRDELTEQHATLTTYPDRLDSKGVRDILHILKNTSQLYGVTSLQIFTSDLYQKNLIEPADIEALKKNIRDTLAAFPSNQELE